MFHWAEEDGMTGQIVDKIMETIDNEELDDLQRIEGIYTIITEAHEKGIIQYGTKTDKKSDGELDVYSHEDSV